MRTGARRRPGRHRSTHRGGSVGHQPTTCRPARAVPVPAGAGAGAGRGEGGGGSSDPDGACGHRGGGEPISAIVVTSGSDHIVRGHVTRAVLGGAGHVAVRDGERTVRYAAGQRGAELGRLGSSTCTRLHGGRRVTEVTPTVSPRAAETTQRATVSKRPGPDTV